MGLSKEAKRSLKTAQETVQRRALAGHTEAQVFEISTDKDELIRFRITPRAGGRFAKAVQIN